MAYLEDLREYPNAWLIVSAAIAIILSLLLFGIMGIFSSNQFDAKGKKVLLTGGSQGMGRSAARLLASKGASVIIVARTESKLKEAVEYIREAAPDPSTHFDYISADLSSASECARIISESTQAWGQPPDILWCCAGTSHPTLLVDTPPEALSSQMTTNYLSAAWTAQAALRSWIGRPASFTNFKATVKGPPPTSPRPSAPSSTRHIIFTSSFLALYTVAGYSAYSPTKTAIRSLADTLSQETLLYARTAGRIRIHTVFPATIYTDSYAAENRIKTDLTKMLEEDDEGQTPDACAAAAIRGLEAGREMVPTTVLGNLVLCGVLGGSVRGAWWEGLVALVMVLVMPWVRWLYDGKVRGWAKREGESGMRRDGVAKKEQSVESVGEVSGAGDK